MLTQDEYQKRYTVLKDMHIVLDADPVVLGLQSLSAKLAEVQHLRNRVGTALAEAIQNKSEVEIAQSMVENQFDAQLAKLMMTDEYVRGQKSDKSREMAAQTKMGDLVLQKHYSEVDLLRAESYEKFVRQISETLEAANGNISRQISVIQMSIQIGEVTSSTPLGVGSRQAER